MFTKLHPRFEKTDHGKMSEKLIRACVHCGFCLATCPTYQILGNELDSPRGRIYLLKSALETGKYSTKSLMHFDRCLTCLSCETTCPSGVEYHKIAGIGRELFQDQRPLWMRIWRFLVRKLITTPIVFNPIGRLFRHSGISHKKNPKTPTKPNKTIILLTGCVQPSLAPNINHHIRHILSKLNVAVIETSQKQCCGALDTHMGDKTAIHDAKKRIRANIDAWLPMLEHDADAIISSASGCGLMLKDYPEQFKSDDPYYKKAQTISKASLDIAQLLADLDLSNLRRIKKRIIYHEPCTLQHGLDLGGLVMQILKKLGYKMNTITDNHLCCGSAGTYSIFEPKIAKQLRDNKLKNLNTSKPEIIATSNIGCLMHLQKGTKTPVMHWVELLDPHHLDD